MAALGSSSWEAPENPVSAFVFARRGAKSLGFRFRVSGLGLDIGTFRGSGFFWPQLWGLSNSPILAPAHLGLWMEYPPANFWAKACNPRRFFFLPDKQGRSFQSFPLPFASRGHPFQTGLAPLVGQAVALCQSLSIESRHVGTLRPFSGLQNSKVTLRAPRRQNPTYLEHQAPKPEASPDLANWLRQGWSDQGSADSASC